MGNGSGDEEDKKGWKVRNELKQVEIVAMGVSKGKAVRGCDKGGKRKVKRAEEKGYDNKMVVCMLCMYMSAYSLVRLSACKSFLHFSFFGGVRRISFS